MNLIIFSLLIFIFSFFHQIWMANQKPVSNPHPEIRQHPKWMAAPSPVFNPAPEMTQYSRRMANHKPVPNPDPEIRQHPKRMFNPTPIFNQEPEVEQYSKLMFNPKSASLYRLNYENQRFKETILFIGNPGVGKSTLFNSIIGEVISESGISAGSALTQLSQAYPYEGRMYIDTPGLIDIKDHTVAAEEITTALSIDGYYRIFFVITLSGGRVKPDDLETITAVMDTHKKKGRHINVIVNKVTNGQETLFKNTDQEHSVYGQLTRGKYKKFRLYFLKMDPNLRDENNKLLNLDDNFKKFLYQDSYGHHLEPANMVVTKNMNKLNKIENEKAFLEAQKAILRAQEENVYYLSRNIEDLTSQISKSAFE